MSFMPVATATLAAPQFPAYWRPTDQVLTEFPLIPVSATIATPLSNDWIFNQVAAVTKTSVAGAADAIVLPSSYTSDPFIQVYLRQSYKGLPVLNTQLHCVVAKSSGWLKFVRCNNSFVDFSKLQATENGNDSLSLAQISVIVKNQFGEPLAGEWLGASFGQDLSGNVPNTGFGVAIGVDTKSELGWYFNQDRLVKAWQISTQKCTVIADAKSGIVIGFNSFTNY
ncbi:UNVERIFIED_CONTAM: hypothetical protein HDU68_012957 [Siphonaria sp. JEL0065]|nr:hypothetical protein HDU68_012957 [Siphonaria sp. JEL0065]